ncbi:MAG: rhomboid family intramembrane serine protease [Paramuribaculum sp.]|nr:rhomboid family intramembrane serine protease [Paramuribaculum sp.]
MYKLQKLATYHPALSILVAINLSAWLILRILMIWSPDVATAIIYWCELPCGATAMLNRPWTLFVYMWIHTHVLHMLLNILWLCWFGLIMPQGRKWRIHRIYIYGGLCGGIFYAMTGAVAGNALIGSSAAVMAVAVAVTIVKPHRNTLLPIIGNVELKWITAVIIIVDALSIVSGDFSGHIAHLGGAVFGIVAGWQMKQWRFNPVTSKQKQAENSYPSTNSIINKVRHSGHSSLSPEERRVLFKVSRGK